MTKIETLRNFCDKYPDEYATPLTVGELREILTLMQEMRSAMSSHNVLVMNDAMAMFDLWNCGA